MSTSHQASLTCLGGVIKHQCASLLSGDRILRESQPVFGLVSEAVAPGAPALCHSSSSEGESQQTPDSAVNMPSLGEGGLTEAQAAYPTDAKEREKARRKAEKEAGVEKVVQKRKKIMEDHFDDCGEDLSSLHLEDEAEGPVNFCYEHFDIMSNEEHEQYS